MFTESGEWNRMLTVDIALFQPIKTKETCYSWSVSLEVFNFYGSGFLTAMTDGAIRL